MPQQVGGDINKVTETEYAGKVPTPNTVRQVDDPKLLHTSEQLRLGYLTGQIEDPDAPRKEAFMHGVDPDFPERKDVVFDRPVYP